MDELKSVVSLRPPKKMTAPQNRLPYGHGTSRTHLSARRACPYRHRHSHRTCSLPLRSPVGKPGHHFFVIRHRVSHWASRSGSSGFSAAMRNSLRHPCWRCVRMARLLLLHDLQKRMAYSSLWRTRWSHSGCRHRLVAGFRFPTPSCLGVGPPASFKLQSSLWY